MGAKCRFVIVVTAATMYAASLALPTVAPFRPPLRHHTFTGYDAFQTGFRALTEIEPKEWECWLLSAAWLVNPLLWAAVIATIARRRLVARIAAFSAVALALPALIHYFGIIARQPGYWCWLGAAVLLALSSCWRWVEAEPCRY
jgi:hypothetical protein